MLNTNSYECNSICAENSNVPVMSEVENGNRSLPVPYVPLFRWHLSDPYRFVHQTAAQLVCPLIQPCVSKTAFIHWINCPLQLMVLCGYQNENPFYLNSYKLSTGICLQLRHKKWHENKWRPSNRQHDQGTATAPKNMKMEECK